MQRLLFVAVACALAVGTSAIPAGAGSPAPQPQLIDVTKVIEGTAPPGAEFVVHVECTDSQDIVIVDEDLTFTTSDTQTVDTLNSALTCTVEETETAGATSVSYECEAISQFVCLADGTGGTFQSDVAEAAFTITNTFVAPPEPVAEPLVVTPAFTG